MVRYGSCVITDIASACEAWPMLLAAARTVHASDAALRYSAWRGLHATWRGYQPLPGRGRGDWGCGGSPRRLRVGLGQPVGSRFPRRSTLAYGKRVSQRARLDSPQPWPGIPDFAKSVTEAFTRGALIRRGLGSPAADERAAAGEESLAHSGLDLEPVKQGRSGCPHWASRIAGCAGRAMASLSASGDHRRLSQASPRPPVRRRHHERVARPTAPCPPGPSAAR